VPTYQYACTDCGDRTEVVQKFTDDALSVCTTCGGKLRKVFSPVGIVFKGSGFYRTDSRNGPVPAEASKDGAKDAKDAKDKARNGSGSSSAEGGSSGSSSGSESGGSGSSSGSGGSNGSGEKKSGQAAGSSSGSSSSSGSKVA
jgi:putative FmdB family regulatory protein